MTSAVSEAIDGVRDVLSRAGESIIVAGKPAPAADGRLIETCDPATGEVIASIAAGSATDVDRAVAAATRAMGPWGDLSAAARARVLYDIASLIEAHAEELATLETLDNGKPLTESMFLDVGIAAEVWRYYAGWCTKIGGQTLPVSPPVGTSFAYTRREPLGVVGLIVPWNFPLLIASWKMAPALAAGNTVVLKPSEMTSLSALRLVELANEAGIPPGVVNLVTGYGHEAGQALIEHRGVAKISFTGSTATGQKIVTASAASLKKLTLELGGKSANIVFPDADLQGAAQGALTGIFLNQGQVCCAGSRLYVHRSVHDELLGELESAAREIQLGHGLADGTEMGPLISAAQRERVEGYLRSGAEQGATLVCGGQRPEGDLATGNFLTPAIFSDVRDDMRISREEIFGPVLSVLPFDDEAEVVRRANDSEFGLAAGLWTSDVTRAHRVAHQLQAGTVWINQYNMLDPAAPFGGYKASGYGRDLGEESLLGFTQTKSVWVSLD
ncbi:aldehyde dehydrogenase DhaS [Pseudonocardia petroleophila]|uniref:Aldehyde dehydrogenase family protein n=1 Tax=Pseudonocardia petroleophila TaxID=37331 RepID=A0A7G7MBQ4_9PSEU|nr:aldehyde dehydrogenase family protein [Pseudonocardia petroleophila]QNG50215.1 aldehyde dehydrogenase family protein [Pseudonocardia petroleophila]